MKKINEKGQALILVVLAIVGLIGITGLTVDGGTAYMDRRHAQNAADTAAMAAALAKIRGHDLNSIGMSRAADNGYDNNGVQNTVLINNPPGAKCDGSASPYAGKDEYIQVIIISHVNTSFGRILGISRLNNCVEAVSRAKPPTIGSLFDGAGIVTLKPDGDKTLFVNGNATLEVKKSGTFVNSSSNCGMYISGNITATVDTAYQVVSGNYCKNGNVSLNGPVQTGSQVPYPPSISIDPPVITCTGNGHSTVSGNTYTYYPGNWNSTLLFNNNGNVIMMPGNYCLSSGATFNGNANITANGVNVYLAGGEFKTNGNATFTCNNTVFYSNGGSGFHFNGNGDNNCTEVTFYTTTGDVTWNGNVANTFTAPTSGSYQGLLLYMPYGNTSPLTINGNSGNNITGTILAVQSDVTINGNSGTEVMNSQIIGYTVKLSGNGKTVVDYDGNENIQNPQPPNIQLTK